MPERVKYYSPTNIRRNQAPAEIPDDEFRAIVLAGANSPDSMTRENLVPNALVEGEFTRVSDKGNVIPVSYGVTYNTGMEYQKKHGENRMPFDVDSKAKLAAALMSQKGSVERWNGQGTVTRNGKVVASAKNHYRKVMEAKDALKAEKNKPLRDRLRQVLVENQVPNAVLPLGASDVSGYKANKEQLKSYMIDGGKE